MTGYSGTPLAKKLGIKPGATIALLGDAAIDIPDLPTDITVKRSLRGSMAFDVVLLVCAQFKTLDSKFDTVANRLKPAGGLWVCWPKKSSGVLTDLSDGVVRAYGLDHGLVDNKVCAIDETWSALRFVIRVKDRPARRSSNR